jgi:hypothetical protein
MKRNFEFLSWLLGSLFGCLAASGILLVFGGLLSNPQPVQAPEVRVVTETITLPVKEYVTVDHTIDHYIPEPGPERVVEVPQALRDFSSVDELREWAKSHVAVLWLSGKEADCDDYARHFQKLAAQDGYYLSLALTDQQGYLGTVKVKNGYHMGNLAVIGNEVWYVEPQTGEILCISLLD